ncbi:unnamed protein product [Prorocentrum cordatum]|uniref:Reverse transcriptase Ty1/copia-type domain-containing protein n=1 Tax=Prorocentrum cordatum TaxID=2364126 RepID=A0ABN9SE71_9DINO|nr:unnamed protein product [Polarella glacialis]
MATTSGSSTPARVEVPSWNGEAEKLSSYHFEVAMFVKSIRLSDRYVCGPQLVRALGPRVRNAVESCPSIDDVGRVDGGGRLVGWETVFNYVLDKLDYTSLNDTGKLAEEFFLKVARNSGETFQDWAARFEKKERELLSQLQAIDPDVKEVIAKPLRTWWFLRKSRPWRSWTALYENDADDDEHETGGEVDEIYEMVEQLIDLADEDDDDEEAADLEADNEVFAQFRQAGRSFKGDFGDLAKVGDVDKIDEYDSQLGHRARDCPDRGKVGNSATAGTGTTHNGFILSALDECVYLLEREGIWAVLDIGATRSLGGVESVENLMYKMLVNHNVEFEAHSDTCSFTFGGGLQKSSMGTVAGKAFLGPQLREISLSVMANRVPILLGMDILTDDLKVVVDCGRNWLGLPTLGNKVYYCERLSSKHLAINLSTPQWWREVPVPLSLERCQANMVEQDSNVLMEESEEPCVGCAGCGRERTNPDSETEQHTDSEKSEFNTTIDREKTVDRDAFEQPEDSEIYDADTYRFRAYVELRDSPSGPGLGHVLDRQLELSSVTNDTRIDSHQCLKQQPTEPTSEALGDIRSQAVAMRWRWLAAKVAKRDPEGPWEFLPKPDDTMLDDSDTDLQMFYQAQEKVMEKIYAEIGEDTTILSKTSRADLMEICCPKDSSLGQAIGAQGGRVVRCGLFNGYDMGTATEASGLSHGARAPLEQPELVQVTLHQEMRSEMDETIVHGCAYRLRDERTGLLIKKAWRVCSTDPEFGMKVGRVCSTRPGRGDNHLHRIIEDGRLVAQVAYYPPAMCKSWAKHIMKENASVNYGKEIFAGLEHIPEEDDVDMPDDEEELPKDEDIEMETVETPIKGMGIKTELAKKETSEIEQRLSRLHRNLGHPSNKTLYNILKASGVEVPGVLEVLAADGLEWLSHQQTPHFMALNIDEGSGLTSVTYHGQKGERSSNRTATEVISTWESWCSHYRRPSLIRMDPEGCHCSQAVAKWASDHGIEIWIAPEKLTGWHSPFERVLGATGTPASNNPFAIIDGDTGETQEQRRLLARKSYLECEYAERRRHAEQARNRVYQTREAGDLVHFWREGKGRENKPGKKGGWHGPARVLIQEKRHIDGRIRTTSVVWIAHGNTLLRCAPELRPASEAEKMITELQKQADLGKTMTEILETAKSGTYEDLLQQRPPDLRGHEPQQPPDPGPAEQVPEEPPGEAMEEEPPAQESRATTPRSVAQPEVSQTNYPKILLYLLTTGTRTSPADQHNQLHPNLLVLLRNLEPPQEIDLYRPPEKRQKGNDGTDDKELLVNLLHDDLDITLGADEHQTVYFECVSFIAKQRRKDKVELTWSKMNATERKELEEAIAKETNNWVQHQGLQPAPASRVRDTADIIRARWLFTRKADGRAKARLVLLGYQTKDLGKAPTASPTASRRARNVVLTIAAAKHWKLTKGDVTSALLQANKLEKDYFIEPDNVLKKAFNVKDGELLQVTKPGYGIGEAPRHWRETVKVDFKKLGLQACELGPCMWTLRCSWTGRLIGRAMAHVGNFILASDTDHEERNTNVQQIRKLYKWGTWKDMNAGIDSLEQRGVTIVENAKGFFLRQRAYADKIQEVRPADNGRHRPSDTLREKDQTILRAFCGEVYWLGVNTMPFLLAWVAELQSKILNGTRSLFTTANNIVKLIKQNQHIGLHIHRHNMDDLAVFTWCDAAWASRPGGHSQGGHLTAVAAAKAMHGEKAEFTVLGWGSKKLRRVARSSLAAEVQEAGDAEGEQCMVRMVQAEILLNKSPVRERMDMLHHLPAVLVTDCRAFYDGVVRSQSAGLGLEERRTAIEALALRSALDEGKTLVRRVHSHSQIADGLTKGNWQAFGVLKLFLEKQEWGLIYDENFVSARKRAALGRGIFDKTNDTRGLVEGGRDLFIQPTGFSGKTRHLGAWSP